LTHTVHANVVLRNAAKYFIAVVMIYAYISTRGYHYQVWHSVPPQLVNPMGRPHHCLMWWCHWAQFSSQLQSLHSDCLTLMNQITCLLHCSHMMNNSSWTHCYPRGRASTRAEDLSLAFVISTFSLFIRGKYNIS